MSDIRFGNILFLEKDREKEVSYPEPQKDQPATGDKFTILAPFPKDHDAISRASAAARGGMPALSFSDDANYRYERNAALQHLIRKGPDWWKGPHSSPSEEMLDALYTAIRTWDAEFQDGLKKNKFGRIVE